MNGKKFAQQIETVRQRATLLYQQAEEVPLQQKELLPVAVEELRTALEELQVAEEELRQQNEELVATRHQVEVERQRYQDLFEFAPDAYLVTDGGGIIREANVAATTILNLSYKYLLGKPLSSFVPEAERRQFRDQLLQMHQFNLVQDWELHLQPRQRAPFEAALTVAVVHNQKREIVALRWLLRDITARKQAEEQLRNMQLQNLQLLEEARLKSQFLRVMSHELRTPMNAIMGFSQLLLRQLQHQLKPQQASMIDRILNNSKNLLALIDDILDFSRIEAGRLELKLEVVDLAELVSAIVEELRCLAEQKHLALNVSLDLSNPKICGDKTRLRQILVNLLSNAIKFTDSGSVRVDVSEASPEKIAIAVKDTGIGIAETEMKHIFKEFRQVNQTIARQHGGTGLGLAIVDSLVSLMKGQISVSSQVGQGSTFRVELPRHPGPECRL